VIQFGPFADVGHAWNDDTRGAGETETLASVGLGLRVNHWSWLRGEVYWGEPLTSVKDGESGAQDSGFNFSLQATALW
jgi:hemolysin activation/secretion protein